MMTSKASDSPTAETVRKSGRPGKRKVTAGTESDIEVGTPKKIRPCARAGCPASSPICFVRATPMCAGNGYTSRWYHVSEGEHFCNDCFEHFYRSTKGGYDQYATWKRLWSTYGKTESGVRVFIADQLLPYWVECTACQKWRQVYRETEITPQFLKTYICPKTQKSQSQEDACKLPEDLRVGLAKNPHVFVSHLQNPVYLQRAVYARYVTGYFPEGVGISPSDTSIHKYPEGVTEMRRYLHPLQLESEESHIAMSFPPHYMTDEEVLEFPNFARSVQISYLILRNTIITLWNLNVKEWITRERVMRHLNCRGLGRIWLSEKVDPVITFLTLKGYINHGLVAVPKSISKSLQPENTKPVIVIGAGLSGLAAARQLVNFGVQVSYMVTLGV